MRNQKDRVIRNANVPFSSAGFLPLAFLGLGIYRAWIEIVFVGSFVDFPSAHFATRDLFDIVMSIVLLGCALGARKVSPFYSKHAAWVLCGMLLTLATVCTFSSLFYPGIAEHLAIVASIAGGIGIALMILIWSELYGCMNPMRVAFYYSGSIIVGALMIYIYRGFAIPWLFVMTSILPIFSLLCAARSFCASRRQSAKHHMGQVLRALENHHPYGDLRFRLRAAREIPLCRHVRPPFGTGHRRGRTRGYGGRCSAGQELRLRHHIPHWACSTRSGATSAPPEAIRHSRFSSCSFWPTSATATAFRRYGSSALSAAFARSS